MRAGGWATHTSLRRELQAWSRLAAEVGAYKATIDDYTNDVCSRDYIAEFAVAASAETREYIAGEVAAADDRFRALTVADAEGLVGQYYRIDDMDGWWWRRRPAGGPLADYLTGNAIDLRVVGYEFPDAKPDGVQDWDANWLLVEGDVRAHGTAWTFRDPCITTWEARALLDWLRRAPGSEDSIDFLEPALAFRLLPGRDDGITLEVALGDGACPVVEHGRSRGKPVRLAIPLSRSDLAALADAWERQITRHPPR